MNILNKRRNNGNEVGVTLDGGNVGCFVRVAFFFVFNGSVSVVGGDAYVLVTFSQNGQDNWLERLVFRIIFTMLADSERAAWFSPSRPNCS